MGAEREPGEPGLVAVFGPKGGVGRTTLAVNLAVAAATELGQKTVLVDGSFQFGDVGVLLNLNPKNKSIAELIPELEQGEPESIDTFVINHSAGIRVLLAPPSPEMAELITPVIAKRMIEALRHDHDLIVVDCMSSFNDTTLAILDLADTVLTMLSLEITSIKNIRLFLEVADQLGYRWTRSGSCSIAPIRRWASASLTWSTRSGGASITRSSPTVEASCTPSTGVCPFPQQPRGAGVPGRPAARLRGGRDQGAGGSRRSQEGRPEEVPVRVAMT